MKIHEFSIRRYGPLPDTGRITLNNFSVIFGKNEDGKTLTIDALVKMLLSRGRSLFERIRRVDEEPEGYIIIMNDEGEEVKLPERGDLSSITDLTPSECRNIFIVRNSDLSVAMESDFYRNVTDRLTGLRTEEIQYIKNELRELGKLTRPDSTASLRDIAGEKIKRRSKDAVELIERIEELKERIAEEKLDKLEEELLDVRDKIAEINATIEYLEDARKREKHEKGNKAYQALTLAEQELEQLKMYTTEDTESWVECETDIGKWTNQIDGLQREVSELRREREQTERELNEKDLAFHSLNNTKKKIDDEIRPDARSYEIKSGELKQKEGKQKFFGTGAIVSVTLLIILIVGVILNPLPLLYGLLTLSLISSIYFATMRFLHTRERAWLAGMLERIRLAISRYGLHGETIEEILLAIQNFDEEYSRKQKELEQAKTSLSLLNSKIQRITETDIAGLEKKIAEARDKINSIAQKAGLQKLQEYREKLKLKSDCEQSIETQIRILESHFSTQGEQLEDNLPFWLDEIKALEEFEDKAKDVTYDEKIVSQLKIESQELHNREQHLETTMAEFHNQLEEIEDKANNSLQPAEEEYLHCSSTTDMDAIKDTLSKFVVEVDETKDNALTAISFFEEIESEEEEKITSLFGKDSPISEYFREITGGIYEKVEFIVDDVKKVQTKLKDGSTLDAANLSGGAYDQLYLSIRLALGEKLLKGNKGFFIMDDPFVKADTERLKRQIDILKRVSELGWQIIYFTAKDEIRNVLENDIKNGLVNCVELQGIFA